MRYPSAVIRSDDPPPPVSVELPAGRVHPVLLAWGRVDGTQRWAAGIAYLYRTWHSKAPCTTWVPAALVVPVDQYLHRGAYRTVQRIVLTGPPSTWPALPAWYPGAGEEWVATHRHHVDYRIAPAS